MISTLTDSSNSQPQTRRLLGLFLVLLQQGHQIMNHMRCVYPLALNTISTIDSHRCSFIYGGTPEDPKTVPSPPLADEFRNVYILTVPAFQWLQVPNQSPIRWLGHTCTIVGKRQMLSIGGTQEATLKNQDPWTKGLGIFDMTALSWTNIYDAAARTYEQSSLFQKNSN
jgi:hypothetical protein